MCWLLTFELVCRSPNNFLSWQTTRSEGSKFQKAMLTSTRVDSLFVRSLIENYTPPWKELTLELLRMPESIRKISLLFEIEVEWMQQENPAFYRLLGWMNCRHFPMARELDASRAGCRS